MLGGGNGSMKRRNHLLKKEKQTARHAACGNRTGSFKFQW
jgi:hypothetical protein